MAVEKPDASRNVNDWVFDKPKILYNEISDIRLLLKPEIVAAIKKLDGALREPPKEKHFCGIF
jgi:hypothetical protein